MRANGVWTVEMYGASGWENLAVFVLEDGRVMGGSHNGYVLGTYALNDEKMRMTFKVQLNGTPRALSGPDAQEFTVELEGRLRDRVVNGLGVRTDTSRHAVPFRLTRMTDLPSKQTAPRDVETRAECAGEVAA